MILALAVAIISFLLIFGFFGLAVVLVVPKVFEGRSRRGGEVGLLLILWN